ncbi:MAG: transcription elongation factor subunit Spt4 [Candidatus Bathyarchaeia archaeon]
MKEKACKNCKLIIADNLCPECKTMSASDDWIGEVIIFDSNTSKIAKTMTLEKPGRYALRVR